MLRHLYAPWRTQYAQKIHTENSNQSKEPCIFCTQMQENKDETYFIIKRYTHCVVFLNLYPYNTGHLLVIPYIHVAQLSDLTSDARAEMMGVVSLATEKLTQALGAEGFNIGFNLGKTAGAGIPEHLHGHVLPRWPGDTNFMPTLMETKQISVDLHETYKKLCEIWK